MKKFFLLTSILVMAACGGGSGGGGGGAPYVAPRSAIDPADPVATQVQGSNAYVTSMASEILVASNGTASSPLLGRSATARYNGQTYTSYRLDDVTFKVGGEDSYIHFNLDSDGKIVSAGKYDKIKDGEGYKLSDEGTFNRTGDDSSSFGGTKTLYVWSKNLNSTGLANVLEEMGHLGGHDKDEVANIISQHFDSAVEVESDENFSNSGVKTALINKISSKLDSVKNSQPDNSLDAAFADALDFYSLQVNSQDTYNPETYTAKLDVTGANAGLKYADLGIAYLRKSTANDAEIKESIYTPYVGGYNVLKVNPEDLQSETTTFYGTVVAGLEKSTKVDGTKQPKTGVLVRDNAATLAMHNNGNSELVMQNLVVNDGSALDGTKWYNLTIQKDANGVPTFIVGGTNTVTGYGLPNLASGGTVQFIGNDYNASEQEYIKNVGSNGTGTRQGGFIETTAYGLDASDEHMEATARFGFSDQVYSNNNADQTGVAIYGAFGGNLTPPEVP